MKVVWSATAAVHLTAIHEIIARDSEQYALCMIDRLTRRSQQIGLFPKSGQVVPEYNDLTIREVIEGPYRIIYRIDSDRIVVASVVHGARMLPLEKPNPGSRIE